MLERATITVSTRSHWYQVTTFPIDSAEMTDRMREIAVADWRRYRGYRRVEVTATDNSGTVRTHTIEPWPGTCPHCGRSL